MLKYKVGDVIKVKKHPVDTYNIPDYSYDKFAGKTATITRINIGCRNDCYGIAEDEGEWIWAEYLFEDNFNIKCELCSCYNICDKEKCKYDKI